MTASHAIKDIRYHDEIAAEYDRTVVEPRLLTNNVVYRRIAKLIRGGGSLLDLGCGTGHLTSRLGALFQKVVAVDHSAGMLRQAKAKLSMQGMNHIDFKQEDAIRFLRKTSDAQFDVVGCVGFLHHLEPPLILQALSDIRRILKDGGRAIFQEPISLPPGALPASIERWNSRSVVSAMTYCHAAPPPDEKPLDQVTFKSWLEEAGFEVLFTSRNWEIFPHSIPPSPFDRLAIRFMNIRYGRTGNVFSVVAGSMGQTD